MARTLKYGDAETVRLCESALADLRSARDKLAKAGALNAAVKVRLAINSTGGAIRHAERRMSATLES